MKILIVSHNAFSATNNMGKTLASYFSAFDKAELAQLYIHNDTPRFDLCDNYYQITDGDMLRSLLSRRSGRVVTEFDTPAEAESDATRAAYRRGSRRTPAVFIARNTLWRLGAWRTRALLDWVDGFAPDLVFFAAGDYSFSYDIALTLARHRGVPLAVACVDDFYLYNANSRRPLGRAVHRSFMRTVRRTMDYASVIFTICDKMATDYAALFDRPTAVLHTAATLASACEKAPTEAEGEKTDGACENAVTHDFVCENAVTHDSVCENAHARDTNDGAEGTATDIREVKAISYVGNLALGRDRSLIEIGRALASLSLVGAPRRIDVYSQETDPAILSGMTAENGILFHGAIDSDGVARVIRDSLAVIHTESLDPVHTGRVAYSVSTKIADSLGAGACIFAYGPSSVASMEYLAANGAAVCVTSPDGLTDALTEMLTDPDLPARVRENARALAEENHNPQKNSRQLRARLGALIAP